ncbi:hypothetical protein [Streptomyces hyaluromycini]|uniref:hypothetical protein n=1 Tax=Streptomyces hyaluromycini TaxID=1377993 RepID=UPI0011AEBB0B|nr:hypothetical protein [Streptomyces hyaluromycini]
MTDGRGDFRTYPQEAATGVPERLPGKLRPEIHGLSFRTWRVDDDDRGPYVAIGHNPEIRYEAERHPEVPGEARWNFARRLLDGFEMLGNGPGDPAGGALYAEKVRRLGLRFDGDGDGAELDAARKLLGLRLGAG